MRILGEEELDLIEEQSKKQTNFKRRYMNTADLPTSSQYAIDNQGFVQFPDGSRYIGELLDGCPEGQGAILYGDGSKYEGNWKDGNAHGFGILTFSDLSRYEGKWFKGKYHGQGVYSN